MLVHCPHCQRSFDAPAEASAPLDCAECRRNIQTFKWMVRDAPGVVTVYNTISQLKIGILANAVAEQDELSKSGRRWLPIASIPELARLFQGADAEEVFGEAAPTIADTGGEGLARAADEADGYVELGPGPAAPESAGARARPTEPVTPAARGIDGLFDGGDAFADAPRRRWPWLLLGLGLLLGGLGWFLLWGPRGQDSTPKAAPPGPETTALAVAASDAGGEAATAVDVVDGASSGETFAPSGDAVVGDMGLAAETEGEAKGDIEPGPDAEVPEESAARRMARLALASTAPEDPSAGLAPARGSPKAAATSETAPEPRSELKPKSKPAARSKPTSTSRKTSGDKAERSFAQWMKKGDRLLATAPSEALNAYINAYSLDPWGPQVLTRLGDAYQRLGDHERAVSHYQRSTGKHPQYGPAYVGLGEALISRGDPGEARRVLTYYLERFPDGSQRARASGLLRRLGAAPAQQ